MALNKTTFISEVTAILSDVAKKGDGTFPTAQEKAEALATAIEKYIKSGSVSVTVNATVSGSAVTTCGAGPGTGTVTGSASQSITNGTIS